MNKTSTDFNNACQVRHLALELECTCRFIPKFSHEQYHYIHINKVDTSSCKLNKVQRDFLSSEIGISNTGDCAKSVL